jgi:hypothetical protein
VRAPAVPASIQVVTPVFGPMTSASTLTNVNRR